MLRGLRVYEALVQGGPLEGLNPDPKLEPLKGYVGLGLRFRGFRVCRDKYC